MFCNSHFALTSRTEHIRQWPWAISRCCRNACLKWLWKTTKPSCYAIQKYRSNLNIRGARRWRHAFHTEDPQILGVTIQYLIATATWHQGFLHRNTNPYTVLYDRHSLKGVCLLQEPNMVAQTHQHGAQHDHPSGRGLVLGHCPSGHSYHLHHPSEGRLVWITDIQGRDLKASTTTINRYCFLTHQINLVTKITIRIQYSNLSRKAVFLYETGNN